MTGDTAQPAAYHHHGASQPPILREGDLLTACFQGCLLVLGVSLAIVSLIVTLTGHAPVGP